MVHRIFKGMVPRTNRKNVELDLVKKYITLFAIRHLIDGGIDSRFLSNSQGFVNISRSAKRLFSDWFITNKLFDCDEGDDIKGLIN